MVINVGKDNKPLDIEGHILSGKETEAVYRLIGEINRKERSGERKDDNTRKPRSMARA